ncbi:hypothetical protein [Prosthecodimorpha staleyi]|uniref:Alpha/beta hydrolase n=1 Tax=Prosthecodimorpha staleyi TaxID=2840188 RepID=A0A947D998_9HYPH|nr:hypothetical protein [Prosthecodimorpha staleyi]MBT9289199.1 hypothetical protein [Prosthecodimorpha staleyi]
MSDAFALPAYIARFKAARTPSELAVRFAEADDALTPHEYLALGDLLAEILPEVLPHYRNRQVTKHITARNAQPYARHPLGPHVLKFADSSVPDDRKTLLVAFTGLKPRLMLPNLVLLQTLPAELFDLVICYDPGHDHFVAGTVDYADSFPDLVRRLNADLRPDRYRRHVAIGTSMGGLPAIRYGLLGGVEEVVAISAATPWHINRLKVGRPTEAFDPLCACMAGRTPPTLAVFSALNRTDSKVAYWLGEHFGARLRPIPDEAGHNPLSAMWRDGRLPGLLGELLHFTPDTDPVASEPARPQETPKPKPQEKPAVEASPKRMATVKDRPAPSAFVRFWRRLARRIGLASKPARKPPRSDAT